MLSIKEIENYLNELEKNGKIKNWDHFNDTCSLFRVFFIDWRGGYRLIEQRNVSNTQDIDKALDDVSKWGDITLEDRIKSGGSSLI